MMRTSEGVNITMSHELFLNLSNFFPNSEDFIQNSQLVNLTQADSRYIRTQSSLAKSPLLPKVAFYHAFEDSTWNSNLGIPNEVWNSMNVPTSEFFRLERYDGS